MALGGYWPFQLENDSPTICDLLAYLEQNQATGTEDVDFPMEQAGAAAAELTARSNQLALEHGMTLLFGVHALRGNYTSICAFRKETQASTVLPRS